MTRSTLNDVGLRADAARLRIADDVWLSRMMERSVFRVDVNGVDALMARDCDLLRAHAARGGPALYYAKVDTSAVAAVRALSRAGMHVVDVSVALDFDDQAPRCLVARKTVMVDDCGPEDADAVLDIAGSCFRYSRFHVDPDVPRAIAHRIKREWVANYVRGQRGERLLVARRDGRPVGFLAVMSSREADRPIRIIDLVGVHDDYQRQGVGTALVEAFLGAAGQGDGRRVVTQASNIPSLVLYERLGFRVTRTGYVLHMHV